MIKQNFDQPSNIKYMINIGATLDIPTGFYVKGAHGESLLLGGLGGITAVVGRGNRYKSTIMHYMMLSAADKLSYKLETSMGTYDTEINIHEHALARLTERFDNFKDRNILNDGTWQVTDKTIYYANKWFEKLKEYLKVKEDNSKKLEVETPFLSRDKVTKQKMIMPTFSEVDSFSEFETENIAKMQDDNELGDSGGNTIHMRQGLDKTRFLMEVPTLFGSNNHFLLMTAHLGADIQVASGPYAAPPPKKLQHMKMGEKIKGVTDKFFFLMNNCWHATNATPLINQGTKGPEYPKNSTDNANADTDLNVVALTQLRGKSGPSGFTLDIVVSQYEGVLPSLTEFHYIKNEDRFGIEGSLQNYNLILYPEVKLSRTTVRSKIDSDNKLRRALNITSELRQIHQYYRHLDHILCTPKELYEDIKKLGYDWNMILDSTRGWWKPENDDHPLYFLSTMDLIHMRLGAYHPYWLEEDKKTIKKHFIK
jgi:hypothetical protein